MFSDRDLRGSEGGRASDGAGQTTRAKSLLNLVLKDVVDRLRLQFRSASGRERQKEPTLGAKGARNTKEADDAFQVLVRGDLGWRQRVEVDGLIFPSLT